jgi:hypothetical protein
VSPVWRAKLCRGEWSCKESTRCIHLDEGAKDKFQIVLDLISGHEVTLDGGIAELINVGQFAILILI